MRAKKSGTWRDTNPKVKIGGTWTQVKRIWVKKAGTWQLNWGFTWTYTFPAGTYNNYTLTSISGYDDSFDVVITIPSNATFVASSTSNYALRTGTFNGNNLKIINNGNIYGRGGNGGNGGNANGSTQTAGSSGSAGGPGFYADAACTIDNNGTIAGGGGGGGGGGGHIETDSVSGSERACGGGGGGGAPYGSGGSHGSTQGGHGGNGGTAGLTSPGVGGGGGHEAEDDTKLASGDANGGDGGSGGNVGSNGSTGGSGGAGGGSGGGSGTAYAGQTITWI